MLTADLRRHLSENFDIVYREFDVICCGNLQANRLLSRLFWWKGTIDNEPKRNGWLFKTAKDLKAEIGLTRRGYEKARRFLFEKGLIQYRRGGVHGKMHWRINKERLLELVYQLKGETAPEWVSNYHHDLDNFRLASWIPLNLWNAFIKMRREKGRTVGTRQKKILLSQLKDLKTKGLDIARIMQKTLAAGWSGFYAPSGSHANRQPQADDGTAKLKAEYKAYMAEQQREAEAPDKPPPKPDKEAQQAAENNRKALQNFIKKRGRKQ